MITYLRTLKPSALRGTALVRLDFNTEDEWRMRAALPTLRFLMARNVRVVAVSHRGRPEGVRVAGGVPRGFDRSLSLKTDARELSRLLRRPVRFIPHFRFGEIRDTVHRSPPGSVFLLENLRFLPGEEANSRSLARSLASLADFYVNDAFAVSHRDDASVDAVTRCMPSYAGLGLEDELRHLRNAMRTFKKPLVVVLGGGKSHDKLPVMQYFKRKAAVFIVGGAVSNTILRAEGFIIGTSTFDNAPGPAIREVIRYTNLLLPVDYHVRNEKILDVGPKSVRLFARHIKRARTVIWNGPFGVIEDPRFRSGTLGIARAIAANRRAFSLAGGGETVMFLKHHRLDKKFSFISTGGGAMLEFLSGKKLPGIEALKR